MPVKHINTDDAFNEAMATAGANTVFVHFFAEWCEPCKDIAPFFDSLSNKYPQMEFLKVDVDKCQITASSNAVNAMPTFITFVNKSKVDALRGANQEGLGPACEALNDMITRWVDIVDLSEFISMKEFTNKKTGEILVLVQSSVVINMRFIKLKVIGNRTPRTLRLYTNLPKTLDFDGATATEAAQTLEFGSAAQGEDGELKQLCFVKFQNVQIFITDNQRGGDVTELAEMKIYGTICSSDVDLVPAVLMPSAVAVKEKEDFISQICAEPVTAEEATKKYDGLMSLRAVRGNLRGLHSNIASFTEHVNASIVREENSIRVVSADIKNAEAHLDDLKIRHQSHVVRLEELHAYRDGVLSSAADNTRRADKGVAEAQEALGAPNLSTE